MHTRNGTKRTWRALALCATLGLLVPAAAAADDPEAAPPADSAEHPTGYTPDLAVASQTATVSVGSTEGFEPAEPGTLGMWGSGALDPNSPRWYSGTSGATGMWNIEGQLGTTFTIDSCGSSFPAQLAVYYRPGSGGRPEFITSQAAYTSDGCANPITLPYGSLTERPVGIVRIDDASGVGGEYKVSYSRTLPETTPPRVRVLKPVVGDVSRPRGARRVGEARVSFDYRVVDDDGSYPVRTQCVIANQELEAYCNVRTPTVTFRHVRSGRHTFEITATDAAGNQASFQRKFRVPYLKPRR